MRVLKIEEDKRLIDSILNRSLTIDKGITERVRGIIEDVRLRGDEALLEYTEMFDGIRLSPSSLRVTDEEIEEAYRNTDDGLKEILSIAQSNIEGFHKEELLRFKSWMKDYGDGILLGQVYRPIEKIGVYVPAGTAPLFSTVLMACIPAKVAGVKEIVISTPPKRDGKVDPYILTAARILGIGRIYRLGGAQAIAALAFGTSTIDRVDKIVGPGNLYVTAAKQILYGYVGLDTLAGPSEVAILADEGANPSYIAADMLAQAEHDLYAGILLVTTSERIADEVASQIPKQMEGLNRKEIISSSIDRANIVIVRGLDEAISIVNQYAPEHLELLIDNPLGAVEKITNAGAIFLGPYSPTALGDYLAGPSHVLPTMGAARFSSALGVCDFLKSSSIISYDRSNLEESGLAIIKMAEIEGLKAHGQSIRIRMERNRSEVEPEAGLTKGD